MTTRQTWAHELAARCKRAGWPVDNADAGYKVRTPDGVIIPLHQSNSSQSLMRDVVRQLEKAGLTEAESKAEARRDRRREARLAADRAANEAKAKKMAARSAAVARAAGPYLRLEEVDDAWYLARHPGIWVRWCLIGPEQARRLLDKTNTANRPLSARRVERYTEIMAGGYWLTTHQGVAFDTDGALQDGQHRLESIVESGKPAPLIVFVGMPAENYRAIDEGLNRTAPQLLAREGVANGTTHSAAVRLVAAYLGPNPRGKRVYTNMAILDAWHGAPESMTEAVTWARKHYRTAGTPPGPLAAAHYLLYRANGEHNPYVAAFLRGYATGLQGESRMVLDDDDPRAMLRRWQANRAGTRTEHMTMLAAIIKTWNYVVAGTRRTNLRMANDMVVPRVAVCRPDGDNPSGPPPALASEVAT